MGSAASAGVAYRVSASACTSWRSATFDGGKHMLTIVAASSAALDRWLQDLAELDLKLPRHLLASMGVVSKRSADGETVAMIEALTVARTGEARC